MDSAQDRRKRDGSPSADGGGSSNNKNHDNGDNRRRGGNLNDNNNQRRHYGDRDGEDNGVVYFLYGDMKENDRDKDAYVETLKRELIKVDSSCVQTRRLVEAEINRLHEVKAYPQDHIQLHRDRLIKLSAKVAVPIHEYPQVSFLGRIFGPGGENLKNLCRQTRAKIGLFGAGCTKSPEKEKEMLKRNDPQYDHLNEAMHLYIETIGFPAEAYARIAHVMNEARKFMDPYYPGITNMKPEDLKRLIHEQRRLNEANNRSASSNTESSYAEVQTDFPLQPDISYAAASTTTISEPPPSPVVSRSAIDNALKQLNTNSSSASARRMSPPASAQQRQPPLPPSAPPHNLSYPQPPPPTSVAAIPIPRGEPTPPKATNMPFYPPMQQQAPYYPPPQHQQSRGGNSFLEHFPTNNNNMDPNAMYGMQPPHQRMPFPGNSNAPHQQARGGGPPPRGGMPFMPYQ